MLKYLCDFLCIFEVIFLKKVLKKICEGLGIEIFGFCDFSLLENELFDCAAKKKLPDNVTSVITFLFPYKVKKEKPKNISRYATVKDYHKVCSKILEEICFKLKENFKENKFIFFIDNSPINEVKAAVYSGLGVMGKNGLLINEKYGSFCFIGEIVTDFKIQTVNINNTKCIECNVCIKNCPSGFLSDKNNKCLSSVTQQKQPLTKFEEEMIKKEGCIWGCDKCQEVCPMNKDKEFTKINEFIISYKNEYTENEDITDRAFQWRGEKIIKRNYDILK